MTHPTSAQFSGQKINCFLDRVAQVFNEGTCPPIVVDLNLTDICNHHCPDCKGYRTGTATLSLDQICDYLKQFKDFGGKAVSFGGGGDPLCSPQFTEAVRTARELGLDVGVITNGQLLDGPAADAMVDFCTWVRISLDADCEETHMRTHGTQKWGFDRILDNICRLVRFRSDRHEPMIGVGFLTNEELRSHMGSAVILAKELGVDYIQFRPYVGDMTNVSYSIERLADDYDTEKFKVLGSMQKYLRMADPKRHYSICWAQHFAAVIAADGTMGVCCELRRREWAIGDLTQQTLKEIWYSAKRHRIVNEISVESCAPLCRGNSINEHVESLRCNPPHASFL